MPVADTAGGVVDLHTGDAEIGENDVVAFQLLRTQNFGNAGEIAAMETGGGAFLYEVLAGALQFVPVYIKADQFSGRPDSLHEFPCVASISQRAVGYNLTRARG